MQRDLLATNILWISEMYIEQEAGVLASSSGPMTDLWLQILQYNSSKIDFLTFKAAHGNFRNF